MGARAITPLLAVGDFGTTSRAHVEAFDADIAAKMIRKDVLVLVPNDEVARDTLRNLDVEPEMIEERIQFSHTGEVEAPI